MCHDLAIFRFWPMRAHPTDSIALGIMATCCQSNNGQPVMAHIPFRPWGYSLTIGQAVFLPNSSTNDITHLSCMISHQFQSIKTLVLQVASSLWVDIDLDGTTIEDQDSPLDCSFANVTLRVQLQQIYFVFSSLFYALSSDMQSNNYSVFPNIKCIDA